jgi:hypothetical protein
MTLEQIIADARSDTEVKIRAAFAAGRKAERQDMLKRLSSDPTEDDSAVSGPPSTEPDRFIPTTEEIEEAAARVARRAPRGLTAYVLRMVFEANPDGLTMNQAQNEAVAMDNRISRKSVYNTLYRETDTYLKDEKGLWHLKSQVRGGNAPWVVAPVRHLEGVTQ